MRRLRDSGTARSTTSWSLDNAVEAWEAVNYSRLHLDRQGSENSDNNASTNLGRQSTLRLVRTEYDDFEAGAVSEINLTVVVQVDKGAQINLNKAAASIEKAIGQYLNSPQWCEVNGLHAAAPT